MMNSGTTLGGKNFLDDNKCQLKLLQAVILFKGVSLSTDHYFFHLVILKDIVM